MCATLASVVQGDAVNCNTYLVSVMKDSSLKCGCGTGMLVVLRRARLAGVGPNQGCQMAGISPTWPIFYC